MLVIRPAIAEAPQSNSIEINPPYGPALPTEIISRARPSNRPSPRPSLSGYSGRNYSKEEVIQLIKDYSAQYGISADLPLSVAKCESGYNQFSKNRNSTASGVFQYIRSTWSHTEAGVLGLSPFDADANVRMAIKSIASGGIGNWNASKSCWN
ncbi:MAG: transglycosylase SLT domain-containing protein [Blastocatellia bacterium]